MPTQGDQICSHGTVNAGIGAQILIDLAALVVPGIDIPDAFALITSTIGVMVLTSSNFCSNPPRYPGAPSWQDLVDATVGNALPAVQQKYIQLALYSAWPYYCTCDTFVPPNISYAPAPSFPVGTPPQPTQTSPKDLTCTFTNVYNKLDGISNLLQLIIATVGPHGYSYGSTYTVTGTGEIPVSGIVGVMTHCLAYSPGIGYEVSDPVRYFDAGWISFGDANGWFDHNRITMDPQIHYGAPTGTTKVAYDCGKCVSMNVLTLLPQVLYTGN